MNGVAHLDALRFQEAQEAFQEALVADPESVAAGVELARLYMMMGEREQAEQWCAEAEERAPSNAAVLGICGLLRFQREISTAPDKPLKQLLQLSRAIECRWSILRFATGLQEISQQQKHHSAARWNSIRPLSGRGSISRFSWDNYDASIIHAPAAENRAIKGDSRSTEALELIAAIERERAI